MKTDKKEVKEETPLMIVLKVIGVIIISIAAIFIGIMVDLATKPPKYSKKG